MSSLTATAPKPVAKPAAKPKALAGMRGARAAVAAHQLEAGQDDELFAIGQLCTEFGVTPRALRFYEAKGLLAPRRVGSARVYTRRDRARLLLILRAKSIGSTLEEIRHYLDLYGAHGEGRQQQLRFVAERTARAIADLEQKRAHLDATLAELRVINQTVRASLAG